MKVSVRVCFEYWRRTEGGVKMKVSKCFFEQCMRKEGKEEGI